MNIVIFGPPGSGKGTQSHILSSKYNLNIIAAGDLLRATVITNNIDMKVKNAVESGILVEDNLICNLIYKQLKLLGNNFIFDGFPRNLNQAKFLDRILKEENQIINYIIELKINEGMIIERIANRFICLNCGYVYNLKSDNKDHVCERCGNKEIKQRSDDRNLDIIKKRIKKHNIEMEYLREYYMGKVLNINAGMDINQVTGAICTFFLSLLIDFNVCCN